MPARHLFSKPFYIGNAVGTGIIAFLFFRISFISDGEIVIALEKRLIEPAEYK
jgi:hypothetical protein